MKIIINHSSMQPISRVFFRIFYSISDSDPLTLIRPSDPENGSALFSLPFF